MDDIFTGDIFDKIEPPHNVKCREPQYPQIKILLRSKMARGI